MSKQGLEMSRLVFTQKRRSDILKEIQIKSDDLKSYSEAKNTEKVDLTIDELVTLKSELRINEYALDIFGQYLNPHEFGEIDLYKEGDIVVWRGVHPAILRVKEANTTEFVESTIMGYSSLSVMHLRLADKLEKEALGDKHFLHLKRVDNYVPLKSPETTN